MEKYSEEVREHIKNNVLTCHSKELAGFAISCGMTYGKFMSALYQDGIEVNLTNKPKPKARRSSSPLSAAALTNRKNRGKAIIAYDLATGKKVMEFDSVTMAAEFFDVSKNLISYALSGKYQHKRESRKIKYRLEYKTAETFNLSKYIK